MKFAGFRKKFVLVVVVMIVALFVCEGKSIAMDLPMDGMDCSRAQLCGVCAFPVAQSQPQENPLPVSLGSPGDIQLEVLSSHSQSLYHPPR